jgi:hypothetical protein
VTCEIAKKVIIKKTCLHSKLQPVALLLYFTYGFVRLWQVLQEKLRDMKDGSCAEVIIMYFEERGSFIDEFVSKVEAYKIQTISSYHML